MLLLYDPIVAYDDVELNFFLFLIRYPCKHRIKILKNKSKKSKKLLAMTQCCRKYVPISDDVCCC
jgi:hypothetical protein